MPVRSWLVGAFAGVAWATHAHERYISRSYTMFSFSLNCVKGKVA